jgi:competence protein ComFC
LSKTIAYEEVCYVCKGKTENFNVHNNCKKDVYYDKIIILSHYKNKNISKLIKDLKFYNIKDIAEEFWNYLSELFFENEIYKNTDDYILLFPPMKFFKKLKKWYNHSEIIARYISKNTNIKLEKNLIKKIKTTRQQAILSREQRLKNLKNAFKIANNKIDNFDKKIFIIVDDVISTGSTINEISKVLKKAWAKKVIGLVVGSD